MKVHPRGRVIISSLIGAVVLVTISAVNHASAAGDPNRQTFSDGSYNVSSESSSVVTQPNAAQRVKLGMTKTVSKDTADGTSTTDPTTTSSMTVKYYDPRTGKTFLIKHYGQSYVGKKIPLPRSIRNAPLNGHGTGGTSSALGCNKVTISQEHHGSLGETLWIWQVYIDWCWNRANQVVTVNSKDWNIKDLDAAWHGALLKKDGDNGYYDFSTNNGYPRSAFKFGAVGDFDGPNAIVKVAHYNPHNDLRAYYNGTNQWWTSD